MANIDRKDQVKNKLIAKLRLHFGREPEQAGSFLLYQACALMVREVLTERLLAARRKAGDEGKRQVHYLCMEFLPGRSLRSNVCKLEMRQPFEQALAELGYAPAQIYEVEDDPGLGIGGLGRLAAGYLSSMAATGVHGTGYTIRYEHGFFRQAMRDGRQEELADDWLKTGAVWQIPVPDEKREVRIGGVVDSEWQDGQLIARHTGYTPVDAIPYDMPIAGYESEHVACLRLWQAKSRVALDMQLFAAGEHIKAAEQAQMAASISGVLYPENSHFAGMSLLLRQHYFLVSATVQDICAQHKAQYGTLLGFADKNVLHINDTHTALAIPELMRILLDEEGMDWEQVWEITHASVVYTHHAALLDGPIGCPTDLMQALLPRIMMIVDEINERYCKGLWEHFEGGFEQIARLAIVVDGRVHMGALAAVGSFSVSGVTPLHSEMLRTRVFAHLSAESPEKFCSVMGGIELRRWLCEVNPELADLIRSKIGDTFLHHPPALLSLEKYEDDEEFLAALAVVKHRNKARLAAYIAQKNDIQVDPGSLFDVQIKGLHESRRQLLRVLHILAEYHEIKRQPSAFFQPRTVIFGAKAAPGYRVAKKIIQLIHSVAHMINGDPDVRGRLRVVFLEDYRESLAERIIPAAELSEQISAVGREASGTGSLKLMLSGALTIGSRDGANMEISRVVGAENMFLFGMEAAEAEGLLASGDYYARAYYNTSPALRDVLDHVRGGFGDGVDYADLVQMLIDGGPGKTDHYLICKDFDDYSGVQQQVRQQYTDKAAWNRMSLRNIANAGGFAADRSVAAYAARVWRV